MFLFPPALTYVQGSSLGTYSHDWFDLFYQLCSGKTIRPLLQRPKPMSWPPMKVLFPSLATVQSSILGLDVRLAVR